jgi:hypothetical protein
MVVLFNYIDCLNITKKVAGMINHSGDCFAEIIEISQLPQIKRQLNKLDPEELKKELCDYGTWDNEQLQDHKENLYRILWIACGNINDNNI